LPRKTAIGEIDTTDSDEDGIYDVIEKTGMINQFGKLIITNPYKKDTDGDGVDDGIEMGEFIQLIPEPHIAEQYSIPSYSFYKIRSYPDMMDSDGDGINDNIDTKPLDKTPDDSITLFPSSYHSALKRIEEKHPNWRLIPRNMEIEFDTLIQVEMRRGIPSSDYSECQKIPLKLQDGDDFYVAIQDAVEYFVDTRNHLSEKYLFQFISSLLEPGVTDNLSRVYSKSY